MLVQSTIHAEIEYLALHPTFEAIPEGETAPIYRADYQDHLNGHGRVIWRLVSAAQSKGASHD